MSPHRRGRGLAKSHHSQLDRTHALRRSCPRQSFRQPGRCPARFHGQSPILRPNRQRRAYHRQKVTVLMILCLRFRACRVWSRDRSIKPRRNYPHFHLHLEEAQEHCRYHRALRGQYHAFPNPKAPSRNQPRAEAERRWKRAKSHCPSCRLLAYPSLDHSQRRKLKAAVGSRSMRQEIARHEIHQRMCLFLQTQKQPEAEELRLPSPSLAIAQKMNHRSRKPNLPPMAVVESRWH